MVERYAHASGRRKTAMARAVIKPGKGRLIINHTPVEIYQPELAREKILEPIYLAGDRIKTVDIKVNCKGGGVMGQADAIRTSIAKALIKYFDDHELESIYKSYDRSLIVDDTRRKEPKHHLGRGARKKRQKSYR